MLSDIFGGGKSRKGQVGSRGYFIRNNFSAKKDYQFIYDEWATQCQSEKIKLSKHAVTEMQYRIKKAAAGKNKAKLDFKDGRLDDRMIRLLTNVLRNRSVIAKLDLRGNNLSETGAISIIELLREQCRISRTIEPQKRRGLIFVEDILLNAPLSSTTLETIKMLCGALTHVNALSLIDKVYLDNGSPSPIDGKTLWKIWASVVGKPSKSSIAKARADANYIENGPLLFADMEAILLEGMKSKNTVPTINQWQQKELQPKESDKITNTPLNDLSSGEGLADKEENKKLLPKESFTESDLHNMSCNSIASDFRGSEYRPSDYSDISMISDADELETIDEEHNFDNYPEENVDEEDGAHRLAPGIAITEPFFASSADLDNFKEASASKDYPEGDISFNISRISDEDQHHAGGDNSLPMSYSHDENIFESGTATAAGILDSIPAIHHSDPVQVALHCDNGNEDTSIDHRKEYSNPCHPTDLLSIPASEPNPSYDGNKPFTIWDSPDAVRSTADDPARVIDESLESLNLSLTFSHCDTEQRRSPEVIEEESMNIGQVDSLQHSSHIDTDGTDTLLLDDATSKSKSKIVSSDIAEHGYFETSSAHSIYSPMDKIPIRVTEAKDADSSASAVDDTIADSNIEGVLPAESRHFIEDSPIRPSEYSTFHSKPDSNFLESSRDGILNTIENVENSVAIPDQNIVPALEPLVISSPTPASSPLYTASVAELHCASAESNVDFSRKLGDSQSEKSTPTNLITVGGDMNTFYDEFQQKFIHISTSNTPLTPMGAPRFSLHFESKKVAPHETESQDLNGSMMTSSEVVIPQDDPKSDLGSEDISPRNLNEDIGSGNIVNDGNESGPLTDPIVVKPADTVKKTKSTTTTATTATTSPSLFAPNSWIKRKKDDDEVTQEVPESKKDVETPPSVIIESPGITQRRKGKRNKKKSAPGNDNESDEVKDNSDNSVNVAVVSDQELSAPASYLAASSTDDGPQRRDSIIASVRPPNVLKKRLHGSAGQVQAKRKSLDPNDQAAASINRSTDEFTTTEPQTDEQSIQIADLKPTEGGTITKESRTKKEDIVLYEEIYKHELKTEVTISPMLKSNQKENEVDDSKGGNDLPNNDEKNLTTASNDSDNVSNKENSALSDSKLSHELTNISNMSNKTPDNLRNETSALNSSSSPPQKGKRPSITGGSHSNEPSVESKKEETFVRDSADELSESELANKPTVAEKSTFIVVLSSKPKQSVTSTTLLDLSNDSISNCVDFSQYLDSGSFKTLKILLLRNNELDSVDELCLGGQFANLTDLDLAYNFIVSPVSAHFFPKTLLRLDLSHNKLTETSFIMVCIGLLELNLSHNRIKVVTGFPSTLRRLDLSHNRIASSMSLRLLSLSVDIQTLNIASNPILKKNPQWRLTLRSFLPKLAIIDQTVISKTLATKMQEEELKAKMKKPVVNKDLQAYNDKIRVLQHQKRLERLAELVDKVDQEAKTTANHHKPMQPEEVVMLTKRLSRLSPSKMKANPMHGKRIPPTENSSILQPSIQAFHSSSSNTARGSPERSSRSYIQEKSSNKSKVNKTGTKAVPTVLRDVISHKESRILSPLRRRASEIDESTSNLSTGVKKVNTSLESGERRRGSGSQATSSFPDFSNSRNSRKTKMDEFKYNIREEDDEHFIPSSTISMSSIDRSDIMVAVPSAFSLADHPMENDISQDNAHAAITENSLSYQQALFSSNETTKAKRFLKYDNRRIFNNKFDLSLNDFADLPSPAPRSSDIGISVSGSQDLSGEPTASKDETFPAVEVSKDSVALSVFKDSSSSNMRTSEVDSVPEPAATTTTGLVAAAVNRIKRSLSITKPPIGLDQPLPDTEKPVASGKFNIDSLSTKLKKIEQITSAVPTLLSATSFLSRKKSSKSKTGEDESSEGGSRCSNDQIGSGSSGFSPVPPKSRTPTDSTATTEPIAQKRSPSDTENERRPSIVERQKELGFQPIMAGSKDGKPSALSAAAFTKSGPAVVSTTALRPLPLKSTDIQKSNSETGMTKLNTANETTSDNIDSSNNTNVTTTSDGPTLPVLKHVSSNLSDSVDDSATPKVSVKDRLLARLGKTPSSAASSSVQESVPSKEKPIVLKPPRSSTSWDAANSKESTETILQARMIPPSSEVDDSPTPLPTKAQPDSEISTKKHDHNYTVAVADTAAMSSEPSVEPAAPLFPVESIAQPLQEAEVEVKPIEEHIDRPIALAAEVIISSECDVPEAEAVTADPPVLLVDPPTAALPSSATVEPVAPIPVAEPASAPVVIKSDSNDDSGTAKMSAKERILARMKKNKEAAQSEK